MEQIRSVHNRLLEKMNLMFNEPRFKSLVDMKDIMLDTSSKAMKYGLCEKYRRSSASIETIAGEMYFICRKTITSGKDATPNACF